MFSQIFYLNAVNFIAIQTIDIYRGMEYHASRMVMQHKRQYTGCVHRTRVLSFKSGLCDWVIPSPPPPTHIVHFSSSMYTKHKLPRVCMPSHWPALPTEARFYHSIIKTCFPQHPCQSPCESDCTSLPLVCTSTQKMRSGRWTLSLFQGTKSSQVLTN